MNLGEIKGNGRKEADVKKALGAKNSHLNLDLVDLKINRDGQATLTPKTNKSGRDFYVAHRDAKNTDSIEITYKIKLSQAIKDSQDLQLSHFYDENNPTVFKRDFFSEVLKLNGPDGYTPDEAALSFDYNKENGNIALTTSEDSVVYYGNVEIKNYKINLNVALKGTQIVDPLDVVQPEAIKTKILEILQENNPGFDPNQVDLTEIANGHATVIPKPNSHYIATRPVSISFNIKGDAILPNTDITDTPQSHLPDTDNGNDLKDDIHKKNPDFNPKD
jgi:hypothetical protein